MKGASFPAPSLINNLVIVVVVVVVVVIMIVVVVVIMVMVVIMVVAMVVPIVAVAFPPVVVVVVVAPAIIPVEAAPRTMLPVAFTRMMSAPHAVAVLPMLVTPIVAVCPGRRRHTCKQSQAQQGTSEFHRQRCLREILFVSCAAFSRRD